MGGAAAIKPYIKAVLCHELRETVYTYMTF